MIDVSLPPKWSMRRRYLDAEYKFGSFKEAIQFITEIADIMDEHNHHAVIKNNYKRVKITTTTYDAGDALTEKDYKLAQAIAKIAQNHNDKK